MMHVITGGSGSGKSAYAEMWLTGKPEKSEEKKAICPYLYIAISDAGVLWRFEDA